jgi:hypothetical protein
VREPPQEETFLALSKLSTGWKVSWQQLGKRLVPLNFAATRQNAIAKALLSKVLNQQKKEREGKGQQNDDCLRQ